MLNITAGIIFLIIFIVFVFIVAVLFIIGWFHPQKEEKHLEIIIEIKEEGED